MNLKKHRLKTVAVYVILALAATIRPSSSPAQEAVPAGKTIIVLDASGSMWGQIEGKHKIEIAREVIADLMNSLPENLDLGLMAYGHNRKGDCADIELLIPPAAVDRKAFLDTVMKIMPKGKTPLTDSVQKAAEFLRFEENPASVILVSDGIETCDRDPCELARKLAATGVAFRAHVVAFDLTSEEAESMRCLADETGGRFLQAQDAESLRDALAMAVAVAAAPAEAAMPANTEPPPQPPEDLSPAALIVPPTVKAGARFEVSWTGRDNREDYISIVPKTAHDRINGNLAYTRNGSPVELLAPIEPGPHEVRYRTGRSGTVVGRADTMVVLEEARLDGPAESTAGAHFEVSWEGPGNDGDYITIVAKGADDSEYGYHRYTRDGKVVEIRAPDAPGECEIRYVANQKQRILARRPINILAAIATLSAPDEAPAGSKVPVQWTGPGNQSDYITIVGKGAKEGAYRKYEYTAKSKEGIVEVPAAELAGEYEVRYVTGQAGKTLASRPIRIIATSATVAAPETIVAGAGFEVSWTGPANQGDYVTIVPAGADEKNYTVYFYARDTNPTDTLRAPETAGAYEVRYVTGQDSLVLARAPIAVTGATATVKGPESVVAGAEFKVEWTGPNNESDWVTIVPKGAPSGTYTDYLYAGRSASPGSLTAKVEAGEAELRYVTGRDKNVLASAPIMIVAATATLKSADDIVGGAGVAVEWTGPDNKGDYIAVVPADQDNKNVGSHYAYTQSGSPLEVEAPEKPGAYEIRYIAAGSRETIVAIPLVVKQAVASIDQAPAQAPANGKVAVAWTGPDNQSDYVAIVPPDAPAKEVNNYGYARNGSPQEIRAPKNPGEYEIRYITGRGRNILARRPIRITAE